MCTYVDTRLSLRSLKYTEVAWLLTCLHLSTSGDPAFDFTRGHNLTTRYKHPRERFSNIKARRAAEGTPSLCTHSFLHAIAVDF